MRTRRTPIAAAGRPEAAKKNISDVRDPRPWVDGSSDANAASSAVAALRGILSAEDPLTAADMVDDEFPEPGGLLRRAGEWPR